MSEEIRFDARGLVPVIAQDANTGAVLTLAYANRDALQRTLESNEAHYYSRSRAEIWHKGASSGNTQKVVEVRVDCDGDALLYRVEPNGPACHTGQESCFFTTLAGDEAGVASEGTEPSATPASRGVSAADGGEVDLGAMIDRLVETIARRHREMPEGSYTAKLLEGGTERVVQKVGEEAVEVVVAALRDERLAEEVADLVYHLLVLLEERGVGVGEVARVLRDRHG